MDRTRAQTRGLSLHQILPDAPLPSHAGKPAQRMKIVGISGEGKTTTSYLIASVLAAGGLRTGVIGTLGCFDGEQWTDSTSATPAAGALAMSMARMVANGCTHLVLEVSNRALAEQRIAGIELDVACVTKARRPQANRQRKTTPNAQAGLFDYLLPEGFAIVNTDDPATETLLGQVDGPMLSVGITSPAEITAVPVEQWPSEQTFLLSAENETIPVRTPLIGAHNIANCLMATAVGLVYSLELPTIVCGLEAIERIPGRLERVECGQPFSVFVDSARTPTRLSESLTTLRALTSGRLICVFGAAGDRDKSTRSRVVQAVDRIADLAVVTGDTARGESPEAIVTHVEPTTAAHVIVDRREAIEWALEQAQPGDCVLIACSGDAKQQFAADRKVSFDDREVARRWLYESLPALNRAA